MCGKGRRRLAVVAGDVRAPDFRICWEVQKSVAGATWNDVA